MELGNQSWIQATCAWLSHSGEQTPTPITEFTTSAPAGELENLLEVLSSNFERLSSSPQRLRILMQSIAARLVKEASQTDDGPLIEPAVLSGLYEQLSDVERSAAAHALQALAAQGDEESIYILTDLLRQTPPADWQAAAVSLSPLWSAKRETLELFFDRLDDGFLHPATMTVLLDLAAYCVRKGKLPEHPWQHRHDELNSLLASVALRLQNLESNPAKFGNEVAQVQQVLGESVAMTIALCDALGLICHSESESSLQAAMQLSHRRIQVEAAAALARLGNEAGKEKLVQLASDPVARARVVNYAEEIGLVEAIDEEFRLPHALAESELSAWLAGAEQFGLPPSEMELIDARTQYWPSFEAPQNCYLFRYTYRFAEHHLSNLGIAGPLTHAFNSDLSSLPVEDVYAAFAGWQAEHEDIFEVPLQVLNSAQRREADRLTEVMLAHDLTIEEPFALTFFLGEIALLAKTKKGEKRQLTIADGVEILSYPLVESPTAISPEIVLAIYRGRKLLRTFN